MKNKHFILIAVLLIVVTVITTGCANVNHKDSMSTDIPDATKPWEVPPTILITPEAIEWRMQVLYEYHMAFPYVSIVAFTEEQQAELDAVPEKFEDYKENFHVEIKDPTPLTKLLLAAAISDSVYDRLDAANHAECPDELLFYIATNEPDMVVRYRAFGNILARDDFPSEYLEQMALNEDDDTRFVAVIHNNRNENVLILLLNDPADFVAREVNFAIGEAV